jgi:V/A-type H+-transporting ATPase subunit F
MRIFAVCDDRDTLTGLRLAGIEGKYVTDKREVKACIEAVRLDPDIAVLVITEGCAALAQNTVNELRFSRTNPLLVVVPDSHGTSEEAGAITALIREAIGVKI